MIQVNNLAPFREMRRLSLRVSGVRGWRRDPFPAFKPFLGVDQKHQHDFRVTINQLLLDGSTSAQLLEP